MSIENIIKGFGKTDRLSPIGRRDFLIYSTIVLSGCSTTPIETPEDISDIDWDCNPILPIPKKGCYIGTNQIARGLSGGVANSAATIWNFNNRYGKYPTFVAPGAGRLGGTNDIFPHTDVNNAHLCGVIPAIRYAIMPFEGYKPIIAGKHDDQIKSFTADCAKKEKPIVFIPFQHPNISAKHYEWGEKSPDRYKETWVHMHDIARSEGASNLLWSLKLKAGKWRHWVFPDPFKYIPPEKYFDIIGWAPNNMCEDQFGLYCQSFKSLFDSYYNRAAKKYPRKIQVIWELASDAKYNQDEWYNNALTLIKHKYPRVKGVNLDENEYHRFGFHTNPIPTKKSAKIIKQHFADPHYIGNILPIIQDPMELL